jgi:hypothetical protein
MFAWVKVTMNLIENSIKLIRYLVIYEDNKLDLHIANNYFVVSWLDIFFCGATPQLAPRPPQF